MTSVANNHNNNNSAGNVIYSCVKCRCVLFHQSQVILHDASVEAHGHKDFVKNKYTITATGNNCTSVFLDPSQVPWVVAGEENSEELQKYQNKKHRSANSEKNGEGNEEDNNDNDDEWENYNNYNTHKSYGKKAQSDDEKDLLCPNQKCKAKLGSKQWQGTQCSCGIWVAPAFKVLLSRVDAFPVSISASSGAPVQLQQQKQPQNTGDEGETKFE